MTTTTECGIRVTPQAKNVMLLEATTRIGYRELAVMHGYSEEELAAYVQKAWETDVESDRVAFKLMSMPSSSPRYRKLVEASACVLGKRDVPLGLQVELLRLVAEVKGGGIKEGIRESSNG